MSRYRETAFGLLVVFAALALFTISADVRDFTNSKIDAAFMPRIAAGMLLVLGLITAVSGWKALPEAQGNDQSSKTEEVPNIQNGAVFVVASMLWMLAYVALLDTVGFVICSVAYVFGQILMLRKQAKKRWGIFVSVSVGVPIVAYVLFVYVFEVMVPPGILG